MKLTDRETISKFLDSVGLTWVSGEHTGSKSKLLIRCSRGHESYKTWKKLRRKTKCIKCKAHDPDVLNSVIQKMGYHWVSGLYICVNSEIVLECPKGHTFKTSWKKFSNNNGCLECRGIIPITRDRILDLISLDGFNLYSFEEPIHSRSEIKLICPTKGHIFESSWHFFKSGYRCSVCSGKRRYRYDEIKQEIEKYGFKLLSKDTGYKKSEKLTLECPLGHKRNQTWRNFNLYHSCSTCNKNTSVGENELITWLDGLGIAVQTRCRDIIKGELDIYLPEYQLAIEYNGLYWHSDKFRDQHYHVRKTDDCDNLGISLLTIFEDEWKFKKQQIKNILKYHLGLCEKIKVEDCRTDYVNKIDAISLLKEVTTTIYDFDYGSGMYHRGKLIAVVTISESNFTINNLGMLPGVFVEKGFNILLHNFPGVGIVIDRRFLNTRILIDLGFVCSRVIPPKLNYAWGDKRGLDSSEFKKFRRLWDCGEAIYKRGCST